MADDMTVIGKRKIMWEGELPPAPELPSINVQKDFIVEPVPSGSTMVTQMKRFYKKREGNGHKSEKTRDLFDYERDIIKEDLFLPKNGQISNDDCVIFRNARVNDIAGNSCFKTIAIFQVTGYVSVLHTHVADGRLMVNNVCAYEEWMRTKYGRLWARYNHPLYVKARTANREAVAQGHEPQSIARYAREERIRTVNHSVQEPDELQNIVESVTGSGTVNLTPSFVSFRKGFAKL